MKSLSHVWLFATPWTVAHHTPLSMGILQARILEWVIIPSSRGSSQPRDQTQVSRIAGGFVTVWTTREAKNTGVGSLSLLQGNFLTQELNWGILHCRQILYQLSHQGSPRILEWVAYPFSRESSLPGNRTGVSCIAGGFFTSVSRKCQSKWKKVSNSGVS